MYDALYLRKAKFVLKVYNNLTPYYITEKFTTRNNLNTSINPFLLGALSYIILSLLLRVYFNTVLYMYMFQCITSPLF